MRALILLLAALPAWGALVTITDTLKTPMGGTFGGRVTISLAGTSAQPLYNSSGDTLTGWETTVTVTNGAFSIQLEANDTITPAGTSYRIRMTPGNGTKETLETWIVPTSASPLKLSAIRSTTIPTPSMMISPQQITSGGAVAGQGLVYSGTSWGPAYILLDPATTLGDMHYRGAGGATRLPIGSANQVLGVSAGLPAWIAPPACATCVVTGGSYADPAWITSLAGSKISGAVPTATALATALPSTRIPFGDGTGVPVTDATLTFDTSLKRLILGSNAPTSDNAPIVLARAITGASVFAHGIQDENTFVSTTTGGYASFNSVASFGSTNPLSHMYGLQYMPTFSGAKTVTTTIGMYASPSVGTGTTITSNYGVYVDDYAGVGTVGQSFGVYIAALSKPSVGYGVYSVSPNRNYFGGLTGVGVGSTAYLSRLHVAEDVAPTTGNQYAQLVLTGSTLTTKQLRIGYDTNANVGAIQAEIAGTGFSPLSLQYAGGNVLIGKTADDGSNKLQVNGNISATTVTAALTGNASTASALTTTIAAGRLWLGQGTGVPTSDSGATFTTGSNINALTLTDGSAQSTASSLNLNWADGNAKARFGTNNSLPYLQFYSTVGASSFYILNAGDWRVWATSASTLSFGTNNTERARFGATTGNFLNGTTTDLGYGLHAAKAGASGTFLCYDPTATTGVSRCVFQAGAGQVSSIIDVRSSAGATISRITAGGSLEILGGSILVANAGYTLGEIGINTRLEFASGRYAAWSSTTDSNGTKDTSISRFGAAAVQIGDGGANANGTLNAANVAASGILRADDLRDVSGALQIKPSGTVAAYFSATQAILRPGNVGVLYTTQTGVGIGIGNTTTSNTLTVQDTTATTGNTKSVFKNGAGQSTNLTEWQNNGGTVQAAVDASGQFQKLNGASLKVLAYNAGFKMSSDSAVRFSNNIDVLSGSEDVTLDRFGAGSVSLSDATNGSGLARYIAKAVSSGAGTDYAVLSSRTGDGNHQIGAFGVNAYIDSTNQVLNQGTRIDTNAGAWLLAGKASVSAFESQGELAFTYVSAAGTASTYLSIGYTGLFRFSGVTSSFPALKRSSAILQARLADDSAFTDVSVNALIVNKAAPSASTDACTAGQLWAADSGGTKYTFYCVASGTIVRAAFVSF